MCSYGNFPFYNSDSFLLSFLHTLMSKQVMDLLPLIPGRDGSQNAIRPLREAFQDILDGKLYPKKVAEYIINCQVDEDLRIKENAEQVLQVIFSIYIKLKNST